MKKKRSTKTVSIPDPLPRYVSDVVLSKVTGMSLAMLRRDCLLDQGIPYKVFGRRTIRYDIQAAWRYIEQLPQHGTEV